jgi:mRNA-degrading endonuclease RelE of RelBE toxin-antitoxin system
MLKNFFTLGTKAQKGLKILMNKKQLIFKNKWTSYQDQVSQFNSIRPVSRMVCPSLDEAKSLPFEDIFWNDGALAHPTEKWAVDPGTIEGIQAFLQHRSCSEELRRLGRETQQMVFEALKTEGKLDGLLALCSSGKFFYLGGLYVMFANVIIHSIFQIIMLEMVGET